MKKSLLILGLVALALIAVFTLKPSTSQAPDGGRAASSDGTAELVAFFAALHANDFAGAAVYVEPNCEGNRCLVAGKTEAEIADVLQTLCVDHICARVEINEAGTVTATGMWPHTVAFLNEAGAREPVCIDVDCQISKNITQFRLRQVDGLFYVVDAPPLRVH